jgi:hypothetical protein
MAIVSLGLNDTWLNLSEYDAKLTKIRNKNQQLLINLVKENRVRNCPRFIEFNQQFLQQLVDQNYTFFTNLLHLAINDLLIISAHF